MPNLDDAFFPALQEFADSIGTPAEFFLRALWQESTLDPSQHRSGSRYYGLNQLDSGYLRRRGVDPEAYLKLTASEQLRLGVIPYWKDQIAYGIKIPLRSPGVVMAVQLAPGRVKDGDPGRVLYSQGESGYAGNKGHDLDHDGRLTIAELDTHFDERLPKRGDWHIYLKEVARLKGQQAIVTTKKAAAEGSLWPAAVVLVGALGGAGWWYMRSRTHRGVRENPAETFAQAHARVLAHLESRGWRVQRGLKVPHATNHDGVRIWFKTQALYMTSVGGRDPYSGHSLGSARSLWIDPRGMDAAQVEAAVLQRALTRENPAAKMRKAWIEAAGRNYGANLMNAPIKVQQRFYSRWLAIPDEFRDEATELGLRWWNQRAMRGAGVDW